MTGCIRDEQFGFQRRLLGETSHFHLHTDRRFLLGHVRSRNIHRMTHQIQLRIGHNQVHVAEQSASRVPARILRFTGVCLHRQYVRLTVLQPSGHIDFESHIPVVRPPDTFSVQVDIAYIHDALEIEHYPPVLPCLVGHECLSIPADSHLLEAAAAQPAPHVGTDVTVVGAFFGRGRHPVLFYLEIVGNIYGSPLAVIVLRLFRPRRISPEEAPSLIEIHVVSSGFGSGGCPHGHHQEQSCKKFFHGLIT